MLGPEGAATPTVPTRMVAPRSTMDAVPIDEARRIAREGDLGDKYAEELDRESAREVLAARLAEAEAKAEAAETDDEREPAKGEEERGRPRLSVSGWNTIEDVAAPITPYGHKGLVRRGVKVLRGILGNRSR